MLKQSFASAFVLTLVLGCNAKLDVQGSGGGSSTGGNATFVPLTPPEYDPVLPGAAGNPAECPAINPSGACTTEGLQCMYGHETHLLCGCWAANNTELWWGCVSRQSAASCPESEPTTGESCYGFISDTCSYVSNDVCSCSSDTTLWECAQYSAITDMPVRPAGVDGATVVNEMTDLDRQTWCQWYQDLQLAPGYPPPPVGGIDDTGHLYNVGCGARFDFWDYVLIPTVPATYCAQNLALSTCGAPLEELSDCLVTVRTEWPSPRGCGRYMDTPGCADTILMTNTHVASEGSGVVTDPSACGLLVE